VKLVCSDGGGAEAPLGAVAAVLGGPSSRTTRRHAASRCPPHAPARGRRLCGSRGRPRMRRCALAHCRSVITVCSFLPLRFAVDVITSSNLLVKLSMCRFFLKKRPQRTGIGKGMLDGWI
jgi:hypothetical protein